MLSWAHGRRLCPPVREREERETLSCVSFFFSLHPSWRWRIRLIAGGHVRAPLGEVKHHRRSGSDLRGETPPPGGHMGNGDTYIYTRARRRLPGGKPQAQTVHTRARAGEGKSGSNGRRRAASSDLPNCPTTPRARGVPCWPSPHPFASTHQSCPGACPDRVQERVQLCQCVCGWESQARARAQQQKRTSSSRAGGSSARRRRLTPMAAAPYSAAPARLLLLTLLGFCVALSRQEEDSCAAAKLAVARLVPFDTTAFRCAAAWKQQDFILRYKNTAPSEWSFVLSAPDKGSYVAVGFSGKGAMVGSSAVVGWSSNGKGTVRQYYLDGKSPDDVAPNRGLLKLVKNKSVVVSHSGRIYVAFQISTDYPQPYLIFAVGPDGNLPPSSTYRLMMHQSMASRAFNYTSGVLYSNNGGGGGGGGSGDNAAFPAERKHGLLGMMGWGVLMPIGMITARYFRQLDPCWFYTHMAIQVCGFAVGIAGVVLGFRLNQDGLKNVDVHKALGIAILAMASLQVMAILARPDKTSKVRRFWNWYHHNIGRAAILLAIGNIFLGLSIAQETNAYIVSYGVFVAVWVLAVAAFEVKRCYADDDD